MSLLERTLSEIAKPRWEGAPGFSSAWDGLCGLVGDSKWMAEALRRLSMARVLTLAAEQMEVLPSIAGDRFDGASDEGVLNDAMHRVTLPWQYIYLDVPPNPSRIAGCLASQGFPPKWPRGRLHLIVFAHRDDGRVMPIGAVRDNPPPTVAQCWGVAPDALLSHAERSVAVFQWLESINVEIVDQSVTRQVRRAAERRGAEIAKIVRVKLPRSYRNGRARNGSVEFSHRFEVRGHYKFFPESTRLAQAAPEKLSWVPEREGYFRRVWCPPFVKGPIDKPLVPKTRVLVASQ